MREARDPMRFFGLYPFRVDVGVGEHPGELHERNHRKPLRIEGICSVGMQQANDARLTVIDRHEENRTYTPKNRLDDRRSGCVKQASRTLEHRMLQIGAHELPSATDRNIDLGRGGHKVLGGERIHEDARKRMIGRDGKDGGHSLPR